MKNISFIFLLVLYTVSFYEPNKNHYPQPIQQPVYQQPLPSHACSPELISATAAIACAFIPPIAPAVITAQTIISVIITGIGFYCAHRHNKNIKNNSKNSSVETQHLPSNGMPQKPNDDEPNDNNKHPHGIYEDAAYHTHHDNGIKSPRPKNGQTALDNSVAIGPNETEGRI